MATNRAFAEGAPLSVTVPSPTVSGDPVVVGGMGGVALIDYDATTGKATVDFDGVWWLTVEGANAAGDVAVAEGDSIYYVSGADPVLSKNANGVFFGYALDPVDSGEETLIRVRLAVGGGRSGGGSDLSAVFVSSEATGTGSSQNVAHGLGRVPTKVLVALSEFLSNQSVDVALGSHTATNAVVTVTSGVKFYVLAF